MDYHLDVVRRHAEQMHGLHEFQALVHHGGAVHGDLGAHAPVGVLHRLLRGHVLQFSAGLAPEGAAGAGEQDLAQFPLLPAHQALEDGGMLRIHRDDLRSLLRRPCHDDIAGADQGLLVGQGDALFPVDGGQSGLQAHRAGHGRDHTVCLLHGGGPDQALHAGANLDVRVGHGDPELSGSLLIVYRHKLGVQPPGLLLQQVDLPVGGESHHRHTDMLRHGDGLPADGAGAAQNGNGFYHTIFLFIYTNYCDTFKLFRYSFCSSLTR